MATDGVFEAEDELGFCFVVEEEEEDVVVSCDVDDGSVPVPVVPVVPADVEEEEEVV